MGPKEKTGRNTFIAIVLILCAIVIWGVVVSRSKKAQEPPRKAEEVTLEERQKWDTKEAEKEIRLQDRAERIEKYKEAFGLKKKEPQSAEKTISWVDEVRGSNKKHTAAFERICQQYERFHTIKKAVLGFDEDDKDYIKPSEVGIDMKTAKSIQRKEGLALAKSLMEIFSFPRRLKQKEVCDEGIGFADGEGLMEEILSTLETIGAQPKDIGMTTPGLRQVLVEYFREELDSERRKYTDKEESAEVVARLASDIMARWNFTAQELGLKPGEITAIE